MFAVACDHREEQFAHGGIRIEDAAAAAIPVAGRECGEAAARAQPVPAENRGRSGTLDQRMRAGVSCYMTRVPGFGEAREDEWRSRSGRVGSGGEMGECVEHGGSGVGGAACP